MSNLLPHTDRVRARREQTVRAIAFFMAALGAVAAIVALALAPAYILLAAERASLTQELESYQTSAEAIAQQTDRESLAHTRQQLQALRRILAREELPTEVTQAALDARPAGVRITRVSYDAGEHTGTLSISGATSDRTAISAYVAALKQHESFEAVSVPINSLAGSDEGTFTVTVRGAF